MTRRSYCLKILFGFLWCLFQDSTGYSVYDEVTYPYFIQYTDFVEDDRVEMPVLDVYDNERSKQLNRMLVLMCLC